MTARRYEVSLLVLKNILHEQKFGNSARSYNILCWFSRNLHLVVTNIFSTTVVLQKREAASPIFIAFYYAQQYLLSNYIISSRFLSRIEIVSESNCFRINLLVDQ